MKQINFYRTQSGHCPVAEFLDSLTGKQAQKVAWVLQLIEGLDTVPRQYFKKLVNTDDIWEVRIQFGGNIFRLLGFLDGDEFLILTSGFTKKTQKTPRQEIDIAEGRKHDYLSRRQNNE
ncbi:MAG: type II toxin-antitoxin system RelE/ParE family toxin [Anaerolineales bacterium]|nr:type II toxin-antitoxin system RelE/ParE family toxin [Anaerolineales bacterium]MCA9975689.1 type II toxin-antitoxin system RelE/ParE family toxin [Anaerolineales bacterium]